MRKYLKLRKAFTMIELIFVIIVLGIISSIGAEIIANVYEGYILQRAQHRASLKTELAATQIANRLAYAIPGTVVRRSSLSGTYEDINVPTATDHTILQWVGADMDSFKALTSNANRKPGWSGFCDVDAWVPGSTTISTPGSKLSLTKRIITKLSGTTKTIADAVLYFPTDSAPIAAPIASSTNTNSITLDATPPRITEHYKLAWTSYALVADGDLTLKYNFSPAIGADSTNASSQILLRNVSTFEFRGDGRTIRFKICVDEDIGATKADGSPDPITICKEKAVF